MSYNHAKKNPFRKSYRVKLLLLSAATQTKYWSRPDFMADKLKGPLEKAFESSPEAIPLWADEVYTRYVIQIYACYQRKLTK